MAAKVILSTLVVSLLLTKALSSDDDGRVEERAAAVTTTPKPVMCIHCTDLACFTTPVSSACTPKTETYCMSTVIDYNSGTRDIVKGCATFAQCVHAYNTTRLNVKCHGIDHQVSGFDIECSYCCHGDNCNIGPQLKPTRGAQFVGKAIVGK